MAKLFISVSFNLLVVFSSLRRDNLPAPYSRTFFCYILPLCWISKVHFLKQSIYSTGKFFKVYFKLILGQQTAYYICHSLLCSAVCGNRNALDLYCEIFQSECLMRPRLYLLRSFVIFLINELRFSYDTIAFFRFIPKS